MTNLTRLINGDYVNLHNIASIIFHKKHTSVAGKECDTKPYLVIERPELVPIQISFRSNKKAREYQEALAVSVALERANKQN